MTTIDRCARAIARVHATANYLGMGSEMFNARYGGVDEAVEEDWIHHVEEAIACIEALLPVSDAVVEAMISNPALPDPDYNGQPTDAYMKAQYMSDFTAAIRAITKEG